MFLSVKEKWKFSLLLFPHLLPYSSEEWLDLWVRKDGALQPSILTGFHSNKHCTLDGIGKCGVEGWNSTKHWLSERVCLRAHAIISTVLKCRRGRDQKLTTPTSLLGGGGEGGKEGGKIPTFMLISHGKCIIFVQQGSLRRWCKP